MEIFESLAPLLRTFWFVAIPTSLIFLVQTIVTFMGADATDGFSANFDGDLSGADDSFQLFSFRNLVNFLLGLSWSGISFFNLISNPIYLILFSLLVGVLFVYVFFLIMQQVQKLAEDNSFQYTDTLHKTAEVYLTIPANKNGKGKVIVSAKGAFHELEAITENDSIPSGSMVKVVGVEGSNLLIVELI
ncbi:MAG: NfeD family protein [bacterium]|nr:NfeD family protein [bacterium]